MSADDHIPSADNAPTIADPARPYYDRTTTADAIQEAKEWVEEWDYEADKHGYCHYRPILVRLLEALGEYRIPPAKSDRP